MKVAFCLAGQYRTFDNEIVQKTLHKFILDKYDCDLYVSLWDNRGVSLYHGNPIFYKDINETITEEHVLKYVNPKKVEIENYTDWKKSIPEKTTELMRMGDRCLNAPPQLYKKHKVISMIEEDTKYDLVIVTRPDMFYVDELNLDLFLNENTIWNVNPKGWSYYPHRIYDIFYMGSYKTIKKMGDCYFHIDELIDDPFGSNLMMLDCCKMLYTYAMKNNIEVNTTPNVIGDIYRNDESVTYVCAQCNKNRRDIGI